MASRPLAAGAIALAGLACGDAQANDTARLAVLGFSKDGGAFAYEQFGKLTGAGGAYAEIVVLDTATGKPMPGTPFQASIGGDDARPQSARAIAYAAANDMLARLKVGTAGTILVRASGDPADRTAASAALDLPGVGPVTLKLDMPAVKAAGCDRPGYKVRTLAVALKDAAGKPKHPLYAEKAPAPERLCPAGYGIAEVRTLARAGAAEPVIAIVIGYDRPGLEGTDRRYFAVAADLAHPPVVEAAGEEKKH